MHTTSRTALTGVAMSEGEASIVSPFSTSDKSVFAAITVLREGRCCLSTSFYAYDFVLMSVQTHVTCRVLTHAHTHIHTHTHTHTHTPL
jgi:cation-transporting ATPase 13A3/4/5